MAVLSTILPFVFLYGSTLPFNTIIKDSSSSFYESNIYYSISYDYFFADPITFDYDLEQFHINFDYLSIQLNIFNSDDDDLDYSTPFNLINFDDLSFTLPFYTTYIEEYYLNFYLDDWNVGVNSNNSYYVECFYNIDIVSLDSDGNEEYLGRVYRDSYSLTNALPYFNPDEFLFQNNFNFTLAISNIELTYFSLSGIYDNAWENGYEKGTEDGYLQGYEEGFDIGSGENKGVLEYIRTIINIFDDIFNVEILPNIKIWYILGVPLILAIVKFALGWFK